MSDLDPANPDAEAIYDAEISPLMVQIIAICKRARIPMLATFQYGNVEDENGHWHMCTSRIPFADETPNLAAAYRELRRDPGFMAFTITTPEKRE